MDDLFKRSCGGLEGNHRQKLCTLLDNFADIFAAEERDCTHTDLVQHHIDTGNAPPIHLHHLILAKQVVVEDKLQEMLIAGVIDPSDSPWSSPVVLVKKKDNSWRFCVDYRHLNDATRKNSYLLPCIDEASDYITGAQWFSSLDLCNRYWHVGSQGEDGVLHRPRTMAVLLHAVRAL